VLFVCLVVRRLLCRVCLFVCCRVVLWSVGGRSSSVESVCVCVLVRSIVCLVALWWLSSRARPTEPSPDGMVCRMVWYVGWYGMPDGMVCRMVWYVGWYGMSDGMVCRWVGLLLSFAFGCLACLVGCTWAALARLLAGSKTENVSASDRLTQSSTLDACREGVLFCFIGPTLRCFSARFFPFCWFRALPPPHGRTTKTKTRAQVWRREIDCEAGRGAAGGAAAGDHPPATRHSNPLFGVSCETRLLALETRVRQSGSNDGRRRAVPLIPVL